MNVSFIDGLHHFRQGHGLVEDIGVGLQRIISAETNVDLGAKAASHQTFIIQDLNDGGCSASLGDGHRYVLIAFAVYCSDPNQIKQQPCRQQNH